MGQVILMFIIFLILYGILFFLFYLTLGTFFMMVSRVKEMVFPSSEKYDDNFHEQSSDYYISDDDYETLPEKELKDERGLFPMIYQMFK